MTETLNEKGACETPMHDHVARFYNLLRDEDVRILVNIKRTMGDGVAYFDSSSFSNEVAKAIVAERASSLPAGDYAGLVERLRSWDHCWPAPGLESAVEEATTAITELVAERDMLVADFNDCNSERARWRARAEASEAQVKAMDEALDLFESYGCPVCHGDCASANPPVALCPMQEALRARSVKGGDHG